MVLQPLIMLYDIQTICPHAGYPRRIHYNAIPPKEAFRWQDATAGSDESGIGIVKSRNDQCGDIGQPAEKQKEVTAGRDTAGRDTTGRDTAGQDTAYNYKPLKVIRCKLALCPAGS